MRDAGCLKIVFGLESFNQRVMDFMKKGIKQEWVRRITSDCVDLGIAVHCYIIVGFPTEKEEEARETMNFIEDLSLGFFYEVSEGMTPEEAERLYQHVYEKVSEVVCELPFNYSMADGLLYIARAKAQEVRVPQPAGL
jgi:anaerobic magnesium-protoporphyrin IX monomethyl ester cyclase